MNRAHSDGVNAPRSYPKSSDSSRDVRLEEREILDEDPVDRIRTPGRGEARRGAVGVDKAFGPAYGPLVAGEHRVTGDSMTNEDNTADARISNWTLATGTKPGARHVYSARNRTTAPPAEPETKSP
jgi:hypothetical protein